MKTASTQQSPFKNSFWHAAKGFRKLFYRGPRCGRGHTRWDLQGLVPPLPAGWSGAPLRWPATREDSPQAGGNPGHQRRAHQAPRPLAHHLACSGSYSSDSATVSAAVKRGPPGSGPARRPPGDGPEWRARRLQEKAPRAPSHAPGAHGRDRVWLGLLCGQNKPRRNLVTSSLVILESSTQDVTWPTAVSTFYPPH